MGLFIFCIKIMQNFTTFIAEIIGLLPSSAINNDV